MNAESAIRMTQEFRSSVVELAVMENSGKVFSHDEIRLQRERVAEMESAIRTALLRCA